MKRLPYALVAAFLVLLGGFTYTNAATIFQVIQGGTGWSNIQTGAIPYGQGTSRFATTTQGTGGFVLGWANGIPAWVATSSIQNISLTTTGSSGAATLVGNTLNIPQYSGGGGSGTISTSTDLVAGRVPVVTGVNTLGSYASFLFDSALNKLTATNASTTALSIGSLTGILKQSGGVVVDAVADTDYQVPLTFGDGLTRTVNDIDCDTASGSVFGCLASADWNTFNGKFTLPALTLGSVVFSDGSTLAQDNANFFWNDTTNSLGIGTTSPFAKLSINPTAGDGKLFVIGSSTGTKFQIDESGKVGINTHRDPFALLGIFATTTSTTTGAQIRLESPVESITVGELLGGINFISNDLNASANRTVSAGIYAEASASHTETSYPADLVFCTQLSNSTGVCNEKLRLTDAGYGFGTSSPSGRIGITAGANGTRFLSFADSNNVEFMTVFNAGTGAGELSIGTSTDATSNFTFAAVGNTAGANNGDNVGRFIHRAAGQTGTSMVIGSHRAANVAYKHLTLVADYDGTPVEQFTFVGNGNMGIGTTTPTSLLNVAATANARITLTDTNATADTKHFFLESNADKFSIGTTSDQLATSPTRALTITSTGLVGIGQVSPVSELVVGGPQTGNAGFEIDVASGATSQCYNRTSSAYCSLTFDGSTISFRPSGNATIALKVDSNGFTGLATTTPGTIFSIGSSTDFVNISNIATSTFAFGIKLPALQVTSFIEAVNGAYTGLLRLPYLAACALTNNGEICGDSTSGQLQARLAGATRVVGDGFTYGSFTVPGQATTTTATTTWAIGSAATAETWAWTECRTTSSTSGYRLTDGTNNFTYHAASTTAARFAEAVNNTFTTSEPRLVEVGPLTASVLTCTTARAVDPT